jgi:hypothetical protein
MYLKSLNNGQFYESLKEKLVKPNKTFSVYFDKKKLKSFDSIIKKIKIKLDDFYKIKEKTEITMIKKIL